MEQHDPPRHLEARAAIHDLREIKHLYLEAGRANQLPALYQDVLTKTQEWRNTRFGNTGRAINGEPLSWSSVLGRTSARVR